MRWTSPMHIFVVMRKMGKRVSVLTTSDPANSHSLKEIQSCDSGRTAAGPRSTRAVSQP
jgi:hypothetical protein